MMPKKMPWWIPVAALLAGMATGFLLLSLTGCSTPPWTDKQIETMRQDEVKSVPIIIHEI